MIGAYEFGNYSVPARMVAAIRRYVDDRIQPGDFLTAVICNDLCRAVGHADCENLENLPAFVGYFRWEVPSNCWGSQEAMIHWIKGEKK